MLLPVSPSGTGKTLRALTSSTWSARLSTAARKAASRPAPSPARRVIWKLDASSGPASSRSRFPLGRRLVSLIHSERLPGAFSDRFGGLARLVFDWLGAICGGRLVAQAVD